MALLGESRTPRRTAHSPSLGRALVVEDDGLIAMALAEALADAGASEVAVCATVTEALAQLDRLRPHILVLDVHLADSDDGWTLAELVMQLGPVPPLIVFSTATPESIPRAAAGLGYVLAKPFRPEELVKLVLDHRRASLMSRLGTAFGGVLGGKHR